MEAVSRCWLRDVLTLLSFAAKATLDRLNHTPAQAAANQARLAGAVHTILQCLGEDPDREGLKRTPERYAKALLWMTRGYEERLSGESRQKWTLGRAELVPLRQTLQA